MNGNRDALVIAIALLSGACSRDEGVTSPDAPVASATVSRALANTSAARLVADAATPPPVRAAPSFTANPPPLEPAEAVMRDYLEARTADGARIPSIGRDASIAFASEKRDPAWADVVEPRVRDYFLRQRGIGSFTVIAIECRSTMCEILAANRNPRATSADVDSWQNVVYAMKREDWYRYARIREPQVEFGEAKDGRVAILTHLVRE